MHHAGEIEQLRSLVNLCPKSLLQILLGPLESFGILEGVKVSKDTHNTREPMDLTDVQKLKDLHLKAKAGVN